MFNFLKYMGPVIILLIVGGFCEQFLKKLTNYLTMVDNKPYSLTLINTILKKNPTIYARIPEYINYIINKAKKQKICVENIDTSNLTVKKISKTTTLITYIFGFPFVVDFVEIIKDSMNLVIILDGSINSYIHLIVVLFFVFCIPIYIVIMLFYLCINFSTISKLYKINIIANKINFNM